MPGTTNIPQAEIEAGAKAFCRTMAIDPDEHCEADESWPAGPIWTRWSDAIEAVLRAAQEAREPSGENMNRARDAIIKALYNGSLAAHPTLPVRIENLDFGVLIKTVLQANSQLPTGTAQKVREVDPLSQSRDAVIEAAKE